MRKLIPVCTFLLCLVCVNHATAQTSDTLTATILHLDSAFWNAYNNCDTNAYKNFLTDDIEFYHDKGGITTGAITLIKSLTANLCRNPNYHLRREAVAGTVKVYPMQNNNVIYGAVITGEHVFYITQNGKPEFIDGAANFTHLWILGNDGWKMKRILSYNHHAATYVNKRTTATVPAGILKLLNGTYTSTQSGTMKLQSKDSVLILSDDKNSYTLYPQSATQSATLFFTKDRDLTFEFIKDATGKPKKMIVKEHDAVVDELLYK